MRILLVIAFLTAAEVIGAQSAISLAYFGETITHPGLKVGISFPLYEWEKHKTLRNGREKLLDKRIDLSPQLGFYYHQDYQTGLFVLPELSYIRQNAKGNYTALGVGAGYLHTRVPRVYDFDPSGEIEQIRSGHHYFISNYFATFGKDDVYDQQEAKGFINLFGLQMKVKAMMEVSDGGKTRYAAPDYSKFKRD